MNKSDAFKIIELLPEIFQSKPTVTADTIIMGVPAWTIVVGLASYFVWNYSTTQEFKKQYRREIQEIKNQLNHQRLQELKDYNRQQMQELKENYDRQIHELKENYDRQIQDLKKIIKKNKLYGIYE